LSRSTAAPGVGRARWTESHSTRSSPQQPANTHAPSRLEVLGVRLHVLADEGGDEPVAVVIALAGAAQGVVAGAGGGVAVPRGAMQGRSLTGTPPAHPILTTHWYSTGTPHPHDSLVLHRHTPSSRLTGTPPAHPILTTHWYSTGTPAVAAAARKSSGRSWPLVSQSSADPCTVKTGGGGGVGQAGTPPPR
jgi:hypothetical protein